MPVLIGRWIFILKKDFNAFAFSISLTTEELGGVRCLLLRPSAARTTHMDVGSFPKRRERVGMPLLSLQGRIHGVSHL